ncbi:hypothetical protein JX266_009181 [Neoarthrinium moseri]|nr:hypothetical protein JX266_009181 [Neoarthrinium moseri]
MPGALIDTVSRAMVSSGICPEFRQPMKLRQKKQWIKVLFGFSELSRKLDSDEDNVWFRTAAFRGKQLSWETLNTEQQDHINKIWPSNTPASIGDEIRDWADVSSRRRTLFQTSTGLVGLGPDQIAENDTVNLLVKEKTLTVLKPKPDGMYTLVGDAYVDGIMEEKSVYVMDSLKVFNIV